MQNPGARLAKRCVAVVDGCTCNTCNTRVLTVIASHIMLAACNVCAGIKQTRSPWSAIDIGDQLQTSTNDLWLAERPYYQNDQRHATPNHTRSHHSDQTRPRHAWHGVRCALGLRIPASLLAVVLFSAAISASVSRVFSDTCENQT